VHVLEQVQRGRAPAVEGVDVLRLGSSMRALGSARSAANASASSGSAARSSGPG